MHFKSSPLFLALGGGDEIGASSYYFQSKECKILVDAGLRIHSQKVYPEYEKLYQLGLDGLWELDAVFVTHAHLDHVGALPRVYQEAPVVPIYATDSTIKLADIMLNDTIAIGKKTGRYDNDSGLLLYQQALVEATIKAIRPIHPMEPLEFDHFRITCLPAGHIVGAMSVLIETQDLTILFSGDFSDFNQLTVPKFAFPGDLKVDVLVLESTYGYAEQGAKEDPFHQRRSLFGMVQEVVAGGGVVLIPAFALGRSQEIALILQDCLENNGWFPIIIDGLAKKVTDIYEKILGMQIYGSDVSPAPVGYCQRRSLEPSCIIASSGMLLEGSCSSLYAKTLLPNAQNCICFSGYLDEDSPGRALTQLQIRRDFRIGGMSVPCEAQITTYRLSSHVDCSGLLGLVKLLEPKKVILVHGCPRYGGEVNIIRDLYMEFGNHIEITHAANGVPIYL